jgi:hypothetical protein
MCRYPAECGSPDCGIGGIVGALRVWRCGRFGGRPGCLHHYLCESCASLSRTGTNIDPDLPLAHCCQRSSTTTTTSDIYCALLTSRRRKTNGKSKEKLARLPLDLPMHAVPSCQAAERNKMLHRNQGGAWQPASCVMPQQKASLCSHSSACEW